MTVIAMVVVLVMDHSCGSGSDEHTLKRIIEQKQCYMIFYIAMTNKEILSIFEKF